VFHLLAATVALSLALPASAMPISFDQFIEQSALELSEKQAAFGSTFQAAVGNNSRYEYDLVEGWIKFVDIKTNKELLKYKIASVGSYNTIRGTWQWAWANKERTKEEKTLLVRQISILAQTFPDNKDLFNASPFKTDEFYGQEVSGALLKLLGGQAIYNAADNGEDSEYWIYLVLVEPIN
jgi:hypothetical protein